MIDDSAEAMVSGSGPIAGTNRPSLKDGLPSTKYFSSETDSNKTTRTTIEEIRRLGKLSKTDRSAMIASLNGSRDKGWTPDEYMAARALKLLEVRDRLTGGSRNGSAK